MEKIEDDIELSLKKNTIVYSSKFYPLSMIKKINNKSVNIFLKGLNENAEKKIIAFSPKEKELEYEDINFPIVFFKIIKKSKFISLEHKHYLGNILAAGIKREMLGDLLVKDEVCYGIIYETMWEYLKNNIHKINSSPVEIIEIEEDEIPENEYKNLSVSIASLRLDSFVAGVTNMSRMEAAKYIDLANVQLNYELCREKNEKINQGDVIIVKRYGKFIFEENLGLSKKEKYRISIKKFV